MVFKRMELIPEKHRREKYERTHVVMNFDKRRIERDGFDRWYASKKMKESLPPPPKSEPGCVIIKANQELGDLLHGGWEPELEGDHADILRQNGDWLTADVLDGLLEEMTEDREDVDEEAQSSLTQGFGVMAVGSAVIFIGMACVMLFVFHNMQSEFFFVPVIGFICMVALSAAAMKFLAPSMSGLSLSVKSLSSEASGFAKLWTDRNGLQLRYVQNQTQPDYFELRPDIENGEDSDDNFNNNYEEG